MVTRKPDSRGTPQREARPTSTPRPPAHTIGHGDLQLHVGAPTNSVRVRADLVCKSDEPFGLRLVDPAELDAQRLISTVRLVGLVVGPTACVFVLALVAPTLFVNEGTG